MRICPKCGAYYADGSSGFCLVDGTPLVNIDPSSDHWNEGARALKEKDDGLRKQRRKLKWRRVLISTMLVATIVVCAAAFNRWTYVERVDRPPLVFKISGQVTEAGKPLGDVKITLYRGREEIRSELTDAQGKYSFTELPAGVSYIITPDPTIRFTELSHPINSLRQDEAADFSVQLYKISGQVTEAGKPRGDVKITLYRGREVIDSKTTDARGNYTFGDRPAGASYIITPDPAIRFTEPSHPINLTKDEVADFFVELYKISGQVTEAGKPRRGIKITLYRGSEEIDSETTDANGYYTFGKLPADRSYTITPRGQSRFEPPNHSVDRLRRHESRNFVQSDASPPPPECSERAMNLEAKAKVRDSKPGWEGIIRDEHDMIRNKYAAGFRNAEVSLGRIAYDIRFLKRCEEFVVTATYSWRVYLPGNAVAPEKTENVERTMKFRCEKREGAWRCSQHSSLALRFRSRRHTNLKAFS